MKKKWVILLLILTSLVIITGCAKSIEDYIVEDSTNTTAISSMTQLEYTNKISRTIVPLLSEAQTYLGHHLDIVKGKYPIEQEITMVEGTIEKTQEAIENITVIYEPTTYKTHKIDTLEKLGIFKASLERYLTALKEKNMDNINLAADILKNDFSTLKTVSEPYQQ